MLDSERAAVLEARDEGTAPDEVLRKVLGSLDVEESVLIDYIGSEVVDRVGDLTAAGFELLGCPDLREAEHNDVPDAWTPERLRGMSARWHAVGTPSPLPELWSRRMLRLIRRTPRRSSLPRQRTPGHAQLRARRDVALVLHPQPESADTMDEASYRP